MHQIFFLRHSDYWINGGETQPSCSELDFSHLFCSHQLSFTYYTSSINNPSCFSKQYDDAGNLLDGSYKFGEKIVHL